MEPTTPFWFKQRQCKAEPAGDGLKVTGPNLGEAFLRVARDGGAWRATLRTTPEGPDLAGAGVVHADERAAWEAAFELYRQYAIV